MGSNKGNKSKNSSSASLLPAEEVIKDSPTSPLQRANSSQSTQRKQVNKNPDSPASVKKFSFQSIYDNYASTTPASLKLIDLYLAIILYSGIVQFVYACIVGSFPFNSFLSGFGSAVACFAFAASLRMQSNPENKSVFGGSQEKAIAHFMFCHFILHVICINYVG